MKNLFVRFRDWFELRFVEPKRKRIEAIDRDNAILRLATVFETLNKYRKAGLLYVDFKRKAVTIEQTVAEIFLYDTDPDNPGDDRVWQQFLRNVQTWAAYEFSVNEYTRQRTQVMADAEAKAYADAEDKTAFDDAARRLAKMRAVVQLDQQLTEHPIPLPDLHYYVIGTDGPILVARWMEADHRFLAVPVE